MVRFSLPLSAIAMFSSIALFGSAQTAHALVAACDTSLSLYGADCATTYTPADTIYSGTGGTTDTGTTVIVPANPSYSQIIQAQKTQGTSAGSIGPEALDELPDTTNVGETTDFMPSQVGSLSFGITNSTDTLNSDPTSKRVDLQNVATTTNEGAVLDENVISYGPVSKLRAVMEKSATQDFANGERPQYPMMSDNMAGTPYDLRSYSAITTATLIKIEEGNPNYVITLKYNAVYTGTAAEQTAAKKMLESVSKSDGGNGQPIVKFFVNEKTMTLLKQLLNQTNMIVLERGTQLNFKGPDDDTSAPLMMITNVLPPALAAATAVNETTLLYDAAAQDDFKTDDAQMSLESVPPTGGIFITPY